VRPPLPRLHAITDEGVARRADLADVARALGAAVGGDLALHARGRALSGLQHYQLAVHLSSGRPARLFVNDRLDIALACDATGVQLGRASLAPEQARRLCAAWWIGRSVHDLEEAAAAQRAGADYLVLGPVYPTPSHPGRAPVDAATLRAVVRLGLPVIGIGGVTAGRVKSLKTAGLYGVAAIRALWDSAGPADAARHMLQELDE
jgi:thiamine-phosphate pyrophosphorylase